MSDKKGDESMKKYLASVCVCAVLLSFGIHGGGMREVFARAPGADENLAILQDIIRENECQAGMAFLGYTYEGAEAAEILEYTRQGEVAAAYPFLQDGTVVDAGGYEIYAIVPGDDCRVSVYPAPKQKQVEDQLTRIGKIELPEFRAIMGSVKTQEYRNKIEFGCSNKRWFTSEELAQLPQKEDDTVTSLKERHAQNAIGFHITGAFDKIYPIKKCWLMDDLCNEIRNFVFEYADSHDYTFYDLREQHGLLRNMMIRNSNTGEWMLVFQFHYDEEGDEQRALELMQQVADKFPQITSLMYVDNQKGNDTINDLDLTLFKGNDHIFELMEDLKFKVGPKSFYQTNTEQAYHLYCVAREFANLTGNELVYDLYTGTGTIANFV